jgi:Predicted transcriptional regulator
MSKISNALTFIQLLSSGKKYSVDELSKKLEVTPRMVRVYKEELEKAGIYIDTIRGPYGGYVLNQSIKMPTRKFNSKDFNLLINLSKEMKDEKIKDELIILSDKVRGIYYGSKFEKTELKDETLSKYNALTRAIKENRKVKILYYSYNKGENERVIRPYDMFLFPNGWGCAAFCEMKQDLRHFDLNRIRKFELLNEKF